jgi:hypothetical protein
MPLLHDRERTTKMIITAKQVFAVRVPGHTAKACAVQIGRDAWQNFFAGRSLSSDLC